MRQFRAHRYVLRPVAAVLLAVSLHACTRWDPVPEPKTLATNPHSTVRITLIGEGKNIVVKHPTVVGDSLLWNEPEKGGVKLSQIAWLEARSLDPVANGFFALVGVTFLVVILVRD
jgi:hypothetical protein